MALSGASWWLGGISRKSKWLKDSAMYHTSSSESCFGERIRDKRMDCTWAQKEFETWKEKILILYGLKVLEGLHSFRKESTTQCEGK